MIEFVNLKQEFNNIKAEITEAINRVLDKQWFILGDELNQFENEFSSYNNVKYGIGVNSGTDALYLCLKALEIGKGDEVITVSHTFISTVDAIVRNGAVPVFIDIEPETYTIDISKIEENITDKTKAIIPVHLYGQPANIDPINKIANNNNLYVIEDASQAHGSEYKNKKVGSFGTLGCFSFYPTKNLGAYGDSGMIITNDEKMTEKLKKFRNYGQPKKYYHDFIGINSRLDEIQAAVLRVKLNYLDDWNKKRIECAKLYNEFLKNTEIITPKVGQYAKHVYYIYVIRSTHRNELQKFLIKNNIQTLIHYPIPVHLQKAYPKYNNIRLDVTEQIANEVLSLPLHPWLKEEEIKYVTDIIKKFEICMI